VNASLLLLPLLLSANPPPPPLVQMEVKDVVPLKELKQHAVVLVSRRWSSELLRLESPAPPPKGSRAFARQTPMGHRHPDVPWVTSLSGAASALLQRGSTFVFRPATECQEAGARD